MQLNFFHFGDFLSTGYAHNHTSISRYSVNGIIFFFSKTDYFLKADKLFPLSFYSEKRKVLRLLGN